MLILKNMSKCDEIKNLPTDKDVITPYTRNLVNKYFLPIDDSMGNFIHPICIGIFVFIVINNTTTLKLETVFEKNTLYVQTLLIMFISFLFIKYLP